jgi:Fe2+ or Zn2+ uptake regulation protein
MSFPRQRRSTKQRQAVLAAIASGGHATADHIYEVVKRTNPSISLGTIYRNLRLLEDDGQIVGLDMPSGGRIYDATTGEHSHAVCISCGRVVDVKLDTATMEQIDIAAKEQTMFQVGYRRTQFFGRCPECVESEPKT